MTALEDLAAETPTPCLPYKEVEDLGFELVNGPALLAGGHLDKNHPDFIAARDAIRVHVARVCREALPFLNEEVNQSWLFFASRAAETFLAGDILNAFDYVLRFDFFWTGATLSDIRDFIND